jgi:Ca-activated chloride channel family protein
MEQWLRRIPDDPGGLLRRKFRNEHQRRGAPEDETEAW